MVVLSEGLPNPVPAEATLLAARLARAVGVEVFAVALGPHMDEALMRAMADDAEHYLAAPDPEALAAVYTLLLTRVPCPRERYWPNAGGTLLRDMAPGQCLPAPCNQNRGPLGTPYVVPLALGSRSADKRLAKSGIRLT